jgi:hypothetical protein
MVGTELLELMQGKGQLVEVTGVGGTDRDHARGSGWRRSRRQRR